MQIPQKPQITNWSVSEDKQIVVRVIRTPFPQLSKTVDTTTPYPVEVITEKFVNDQLDQLNRKLQACQEVLSALQTEIADLTKVKTDLNYK